MSKQKNKKKNANKGNQSYDAPDTRVIDNSGNAGYMPDKTKLEEAIYNAFPKLLDPKGNKQDAEMIRHEYYLNDKALGNPKILPQLKGDDIYRKNNGMKILFPNRNYERFDLNRLGDNQETEMYETNAGQNSMPNANTSQTPMPNAFSPFDFSKLRWDNASYLPEFNNMVYGLNEMEFDVTGKPTNVYRNKAAFQNRLNKNDSRKSYADPTGTGALYLTEDQKYQYANGGETYKSGGSACMKCGGKMHKSGGTISSCMKCGGGKYTFGGKTGWSKKKNDVSKYQFGGMIPTSSDTEIPVSKGSFNVEAPPYNVSEMLGLKSMSIQEETTPEDTKKISNVISKQRTKGNDKTMPNWGRAQKEQMMLNNLIRKDIAAGKTDMNVLAEDDIIGDLTLAAMNRYEGKGYTRPELFKDKWLAEYKKQWEEMQSGKKSQQQKQTSQQSSNKKQVFNPDVNVIPKKQNENYLTAAGFKKMNSSQIEEVGDGDGIKVNGKNYRLAGIDDAGAFFDAAESRYYKDNIKMMQYQTSFMGFDFSDATSRILGKNESTKTLKDAIGNKNVMIKEGGTTKDGRSTAVLYYQDDLNPMLYHSADSLIVTKGQGVYGMNFNDSKMTPRQKEITSKAEKYKYPTTPYNARKNPGKYMIPSKASKEISAWDIFNTVQKNSQRKPK
jgi:hypothetical protein